ncbi:NRDE family protein [Oceanospirillum beijerinckii]|uniref:NRDE family protein n=1 Tax=Oceanospirillum beijerinckii TaxID=64976 RepID=UPI00041EAFA4|nr:NRDE family protein [Oceanospirillum beijerinckii]
MCLILFSWQQDSERPLIVTANRDEFYHRETSALTLWPNSPVVAGRDLQAGGTWMGITTSGRFAAVTNYRRPADMTQTFPLSRGQLCQDFLQQDWSVKAFLEQLSSSAMDAGGFNLLVSDGEQLGYASNRFQDQRGYDHYRYNSQLEPGIYGLSNHLLDTPWPKVTQGKQALAEKLHDNANEDELLSILENTLVADDNLLPDTGIGLERERFLAPRFIASSTEYGTRASSLLIRYRSGAQSFIEQSWQQNGTQAVRTYWHQGSLY